MNITTYKKKGKTFYKLRAYLGMDPRTSKKVEITRQGFESAKDAQLHYLEEIRAFEAQTEQGALLPAIPFRELAAKWLAVYEETVGESTYHQTTCYFRLHILPEIGDVYIDKIDGPMLNRAIIKWSKKHSKSSAMLAYIRRVMELGIDLGYLKDNPCKGVKAPKKRKERVKKALQFLEREELIDYLKAAKEHLDPMWYAYFHLLAMSGLRRAEALALTGSDLSGDMLTVSKTIATGKDNKVYIGPPKSAASNRVIRLDHEAAELLRDLIDAPERPIFSKPDGSYWSLSRPGHYMSKLAKVAGVPRITPHVLRHTHCALMFEAGAGLKEVQDRLGHEDIEITLSIYNHVSTRKSHEAIDRLTSYLDGSSFGGNSVQFEELRTKTLINGHLAK